MDFQRRTINDVDMVFFMAGDWVRLSVTRNVGDCTVLIVLIVETDGGSSLARHSIIPRLAPQRSQNEIRSKSGQC